MMTAELVARVKVHKAGLLALLTITKTPRGAIAAGGFGDGDASNVLTVTSYAADEARMLADAPADLRAAVESIKRVFPGAELVSVHAPPAPLPADAAAWPAPDVLAHLPRAVAELARRRDGWTPATWRGRLLYLAAACAALHPDRAAELRRAAVVIGPVVLR